MKKKFVLCSLLLSLLLLAGCGMELTSHMKLNQGFIGTRTMSCSIRVSDLKSNFKGDAKDIEQIISSACPSALTYKKTFTSTDCSYEFYITFHSKADYKKKVTSLLTFAPKITYQYSESPFSKGLIYKENFTSKDLMSWLFTAFYEKGYIDKKQSSDMWDLKSSTFSFNGTSYDVEDTICINTMKYVSVDAIHIQTTKKDDHSFSRAVTIDIPKDTLEKTQSQINAYFNVQGVTSSWNSTSSGRSLRLTFSADSFTDLAAKTRTVLHSSTSYGKSTLKKKHNSPFSYQESFQEQLDFSNFTDKNGSIPSTYTVTANKKTKEVSSSTESNPFVSFTCGSNIKVKNYSVDMVYKSAENVKICYQFTLASAYTKRELNEIKKSFNHSTFTSCTSSEKKNTSTIVVMQQGSIANCSKAMESVFSKSSFSYKESKSIFSGSHSTLNLTFQLGTNNPNVIGTYRFVSLSTMRTKKVTGSGAHYKALKASSNVIHKDLAKYIDANDTIASVSSFQVSDGTFYITYDGTMTTDYLLQASKMILPLIILGFIVYFIYKKQKQIIQYGIKLKEWIEKRME